MNSIMFLMMPRGQPFNWRISGSWRISRSCTVKGTTRWNSSRCDDERRVERCDEAWGSREILRWLQAARGTPAGWSQRDHHYLSETEVGLPVSIPAERLVFVIRVL